MSRIRDLYSNYYNLPTGDTLWLLTFVDACADQNLSSLAVGSIVLKGNNFADKTNFTNICQNITVPIIGYPGLTVAWTGIVAGPSEFTVIYNGNVVSSAGSLLQHNVFCNVGEINSSRTAAETQPCGGPSPGPSPGPGPTPGPTPGPDPNTDLHKALWIGLGILILILLIVGIILAVHFLRKEES